MQSTEEGLTGLRCGIRSGDVMDSESWSERCDEAIKRGDNGMLSTTTWAEGFLLRKGPAAEQRGTWEGANKQRGAVKERKKNLASHNRNVSVWKVATQDHEEANKRV